MQLNHLVFNTRPRFSIPLLHFRVRLTPPFGPFGVVLFLAQLLVLDAISIKGNALPLEAVDDIHEAYCLTAGMFGVTDGGDHDTLREVHEGVSDKLEEQIVTTHTCHAPTSSQASNVTLADAQDFIAQDTPHSVML